MAIGDYYPYIPSPKDIPLEYNPYSSYSDFDCVNAYYHINEALEEYYEDNWNFDLGYDINVYTHYELDDDYAGYFPIPDHYIVLGHGDDLNNAAHARDIMLHEVQHAVTDKIWYDAGESINTNFELSLNEAYSDYHACSQVGDWVMGDWYCDGESNCERDLTNHMADPNWDSTYPYDIYNNSLVISHAFYEIQYEIGLSNADDCIFASNEDVRPNDFEDLYDALCSECSDPNTVRNILDTHWDTLL